MEQRATQRKDIGDDSQIRWFNISMNAALFVDVANAFGYSRTRLIARVLSPARKEAFRPRNSNFPTPFATGKKTSWRMRNNNERSGSVLMSKIV